MSFFKEFKSFVSRGNVVDMAVGIIIGASFVKVVDTLVNNILMPILGFLIGGIDLSDFKWQIKEGVSIDYGLFINRIIDFLIVGFAVFLLIKGFQALRSKKEVSSKRKCPHCLLEIAEKASRCPHCTSDL